MSPAAFRGRTRLRERSILREPGPQPGLGGLLRTLSQEAADAADPRTRRRLRACIRFVGPLRAMMEPFMRLIGGQRVRVEELIRGHVACAEALAGQGNGGGAAGAALWSGEAGEAAADFVAELLSRSEEHTSELQSLMRSSYAVFCLQKKTLKQPRVHVS